jgi:hypothetical protein
MAQLYPQTLDSLFVASNDPHEGGGTRVTENVSSATGDPIVERKTT